eukprot:13207753-Alexandrium_andersonii.AAC.1
MGLARSLSAWLGATTCSLYPLDKVSSLVPNPARGGRGPSSPNGPNDALRGLESVNVGAPP